MNTRLVVLAVFAALLVSVEAGGYVRSAMKEIDLGDEDITVSNKPTKIIRGGFIKAMADAVEPDLMSKSAIEMMNGGLEGASKHKLPAAWDWRAVPIAHSNATLNMVGASRNQHIPTYCGSCWLFGSSSALQDRIKIRSGASFPEVVLSPQMMINCGDAGNCNGGASLAAYKYISKHGIVDETCQSYEARNNECSAVNTCRNCNPDGSCYAMDNYKLYFVEEFGKVHGEEAMMQEIYSRGPIVCAMMSTDWSWNYTGSEIMFDPTWDHSNETDHEVNVLGWGEEKGTPYWIVRNSWGTYWGDEGFMKLPRGKNYLNIESECSWAQPSMKNVKASALAPEYPNLTNKPWKFL